MRPGVAGHSEHCIPRSTPPPPPSTPPSHHPSAMPLFCPRLSLARCALGVPPPEHSGVCMASGLSPPTWPPKSAEPSFRLREASTKGLFSSREKGGVGWGWGWGGGGVYGPLSVQTDVYADQRRQHRSFAVAPSVPPCIKNSSSNNNNRTSVCFLLQFCCFNLNIRSPN